METSSFKNMKDNVFDQLGRRSDVFFEKQTPTKRAFSKFALLADSIRPRARLDQKFFEIFGGHILFQTLAAGVEYDVFNLLERNGPLDLTTIAKALRIAEQPCRIMLFGLVTLSVLRRRGRRFSNTRISRRFLTEFAEHKFSSCVQWQRQINYRALAHFPEAMKENRNVGLKEFPGDEPTLYQRLVKNPDLEHVFQDAMEEISRLSNVHLVRYIDFSNVNCLVDVGGGNGTNLLRIARQYPQMKGFVFDSASVCKIANENFRQAGESHRLKAITGDIYKDALPKEADFVMFCHFFTIWSKEENLALLRKVNGSLPSSGRVMIYNMMQNDSQDGPILAAVGSPYFLTLATGRGMLYTWSEYEDIFKQAGFSNITRNKLPFYHGAITGQK